MRLAVLSLLLGCGLALFAQESAPATNSPTTRAERVYRQFRRSHTANPTNNEIAWQFGSACFDRAEFSSDDEERARLANQGIKACRDLLKRDPKSAAGHYYLGMNLGQLARTKTLGALPIVDEMEVEFKAAAALDENFSHAGPDRNLGLLYLQAPSIGSIGSRSKARIHLKRAIELAPDYPENRLNWIEACLKWRDPDTARRELAILEHGLDKARGKFAGEEWSHDWADWDRRLQKVRGKLESASHRVTSPRGIP